MDYGLAQMGLDYGLAAFRLRPGEVGGPGGACPFSVVAIICVLLLNILSLLLLWLLLLAAVGYVFVSGLIL